MKQNNHTPFFGPETIKRFKQLNQAKAIDPLVVVKLHDQFTEIFLIDYVPEVNKAMGYIRTEHGGTVKHGWNIFDLNKLAELKSRDVISLEIDESHQERPISECVKELWFEIQINKIRQAKEQKQNRADDIDMSL